MTSTPIESLELRVLVVAPNKRDAQVAQSVFERAGIECVCRDRPDEIAAVLEQGIGALLLAEESVINGPRLPIARWLKSQPAWSDLPVLILARQGADSVAVAQAMESLGNVTVLERPVRVAALVSAVRTALRARERQYQLRERMNDREKSFQLAAWMAAIVTSSEDAIVSKSLDGTILTWNSGAERLFGYTAAEIVGKPIMILIPPERGEEEAGLLRRLRDGERIEHFETVRLTKDGRRLDISLTVSPVRDSQGRIIGASKVARDITESKRAAEALRQAQEQLEVVTDNMAAAVTRCDRDLRYLWVSQGCATWMGLPSEEIVGKRIDEVIGQRAFETVSPYIDRVLSGEATTFEAQIPYDHMGLRWIKAEYSPTHDTNGNTDGWVAVIADTTARHEFEDALREANRRKDEFLAMLAHELRNPLAPIRNSIHIMRTSTRGDPLADRVSEIMERQVNHMVRLVDDLLEVSRITRGKIELRKETVDISDIIRDAIDTSRPLIDSASHELSFVVPSEPLLVEGDPVRLGQVFANILNNAAKYTNPGGRIRVSARRDANEISVAIRDNGAGIPVDMLGSVFDMFTQYNVSADRAQGGLGIGLTLVRSIVEMHGGRVTAHSEGVGQGSEFVVHLPVATPGAMSARIPGLHLAGVLPAERSILVVDDNRDAAESMGLVLRMLGAGDVRVVCNGQDALDEIARRKPAAVLLDLGMPIMDGFEVARRIRQEPRYDDVVVIALTGWGQEEDRRRSRAAGFDHHLVKPAEMRVLRTLLSDLDSRAVRRA